jgi:hypothetical protein
VESFSKEVVAMCYSYREYRKEEEEARKRREEDLRRRHQEQRAREAREKPAEREKVLVKA